MRQKGNLLLPFLLKAVAYPRFPFRGRKEIQHYFNVNALIDIFNWQI